MGLRVGLLIGVGFALFKTVQTKRAATREPAPEPWQPIVDTPRPRPAEPPVDEVGEPVIEPVIEPVVEQPTITPDAATLRMPDVEPQRVEPQRVEPQRVESEVAMVADEIVDPEPVAKPEPLDIVPDDDKPIAPVKKAAKAARAATKATKKATKATTKTVKKAAKKMAPPMAPSVEPVGGVCPTTHPVKAKTASRLFHLPGMFAYDRTRPDRCYVDASAAEADGYTRARR